MNVGITKCGTSEYFADAIVIFCFAVLPGEQVEVKVEEGSESVILPCKTTPDLAEDTTVEWTHSDPELMVAQRYSGRTSMKTDALETGDLSLNLTNLQLSDSATYTCSIRKHGQELSRSDVQLQVKGQLYNQRTLNS
uniref:Ig-like domain-containing protein n=1 Tax=Oreochromis aureus TaxID=47969 RepID=A0AAZ1X6D9_OREAU